MPPTVPPGQVAGPRIHEARIQALIEPLPRTYMRVSRMHCAAPTGPCVCWGIGFAWKGARYAPCLACRFYIPFFASYPPSLQCLRSFLPLSALTFRFTRPTLGFVRSFCSFLPLSALPLLVLSLPVFDPPILPFFLIPLLLYLARSFADATHRTTPPTLTCSSTTSTRLSVCARAGSEKI